MTTKEVQVQGRCDERFSAVRDAFAENFDLFDEAGAAVAVTIDGQPVIDLWGGVMDKDTKKPWQQDTIVTVYSTTKGMTTICAHRLVEQGLLDLAAPVAKYWPELAQAGKADMPVHMLLTHRVGLPAVGEKMPDGSAFDWDAMTGALARQKPFWEPGTQYGYHALTFGWLVGEVVRRISGKSLGAFFRDEVASPLGLDFHIGVDAKHDARIATMYRPDPSPEIAAKLAQIEKEAHGKMDPALVAARGNISTQGAHNSEAWRRSEIPAANGHSDAGSLARVYGVLACGGERDGVRVLSPEAIARATTEQSAVPDAFMGNRTRIALGFRLACDGNMGPNPRNFGHRGAGGSIGFADPDGRIGFGYVMNQMKADLPGETTTGTRLINALYASL